MKLYRLNADGSWDDCGTGRIMCLYKPSPGKSESPAPTSSHGATTGGGPNNNPATSTGNSSGGNGATGMTATTTPASEGGGSTTSFSNNNTATMMGDAYVYQELGEPTLCMHSEVGGTATGTAHMPRILLRTRILLRDAYQRQGDNIITWCEPYLEEGNPAQGVDLALSFQDNAGCLDIWRQITDVQAKAADYFRRSSTGNNPPGGGSSNNEQQRGSGSIIGPSGLGRIINNDTATSSPNQTNENGTWGAGGGENAGTNLNSDHDEEKISSHNNGNSVTDVAHAVAAAHHASLQRQQQQDMWVSVASEATSQHQHHNLDHHNQNSMMNHDPHHFGAAAGEDPMVGGGGFHDGGGGPNANNTLPSSGVGGANNPPSPQLPNPPTLANLEEIADTIAAVQVRRQFVCCCVCQMIFKPYIYIYIYIHTYLAFRLCW